MGVQRDARGQAHVHADPSAGQIFILLYFILKLVSPTAERQKQMITSMLLTAFLFPLENKNLKQNQPYEPLGKF